MIGTIKLIAKTIFAPQDFRRKEVIFNICSNIKQIIASLPITIFDPLAREISSMEFWRITENSTLQERARRREIGLLILTHRSTLGFA
ncbi:MAG: hypothetical protein LBK76_05035 [Verrucomicrobiales bacterium]|jgi:hypothetical protein|nr:hypothetical protein [Verrucomicrobiales bacterium]